MSLRAVAQPTFSNSNGVTFGTSGGVVTASVLANSATNATISYYENQPFLAPGSTTLANSISTIHVLPFVLPQALSASFIRVPVSMSHVSTEVAGTSANTTFSFNRSYTEAVVIYSQGTGANSLSLRYLTSSQATWVFQTAVSAGTAGSQYTVSLNITYPSLGANTQNYATSYNVSSSAFKFQTESGTLFTGPRFVDIPFAVSLSPGNYWAGFGMSTNAASNAGPANLSNASIGFSTVGISQSNISWGYPGAATANSIQIQPGMGIWTTNAAVMSTSSAAISDISAVVSHPKMYFQAINRA